MSGPARIEDKSRSMTSVFTVVVVPASASRGTASGRRRASGWANLDVYRDDLVKTALVAELQSSALTHVVESLCGAYSD